MLSAEGYSKPNRTSKMERFTKIVNGLNPLTVFAKSFVLDVWQGSEFASDLKHLDKEYIYLKQVYYVVKPIYKWSQSKGNILLQKR